MDLANELENLALSASDEQPNDEPASAGVSSHTNIRTWQERFGCTYDQAAELIGITKSVKNPYSTERRVTLTQSQARAVHIMRLEKPLDTPEKVQKVAKLAKLPQQYIAYSQDSESDVDTVFVRVDGNAKLAIVNWVSKQKTFITFTPVFIAEAIAYKELSSTTIYPTLGKNATLPQNRPQDSHLVTSNSRTNLGALQNQYPVWYFFYGTLEDTDRLSRLLALHEDTTPILHSATVRRAVMKTWGAGKYNALVDGQENDCVTGSAYQVMSLEHEDCLRKYETAAYEVVRCTFLGDFGDADGLTFRFVGDTD